MSRYKIIIEYDGTNYCGWQKQPRLPSIQGKLEDAIKAFSQIHAPVQGSSRTDTGVHALAQVAHFDLDTKLESGKILRAMNFYLKEEAISVLDCEEVSEEFHARFSAKKRYYKYIITNRLPPLSIDINRSCHVIEKLDVKKMQKAAKLLEGTHDFSNFRASMCQAHSPIKKVDYINIHQEGEKITLEISASSFLHNMVRNIVGALRMVGKGKWTNDTIIKLRDLKEKNMQKFTSSPSGLYFIKVDY